MYNNTTTATIPSYNNQGNPSYNYQFPYGGVNTTLLNNSPYNNYMGGQQNNSFQNSQFLKCRPVSSKDEARAFQIDLDGSLWVFTDLGNNMIYTKQINNDGTANFKSYQFVQDKNDFSFSNPNDYITRDEFNKTLQNLMAAVQGVNSNNTSAQQKQNQTLLNFGGQ